MWARGADTTRGKQIRILWGAAIFWTLFPLLLYASPNNFTPASCYQIVAIPLYLLATIFGLNRLPRFPGRMGAIAALKALMVALTLAGGVAFARQGEHREGRVYSRIQDIYAEFEELPVILTGLDMPVQGVYAVRATLHAFLPESRMIEMPSRSAFVAGTRNHELDGLIMTTRIGGNGILRVKGWGKIEPVIADNRGVRFCRVYTTQSNSPLIIYRREHRDTDDHHR